MPGGSSTNGGVLGRLLVRLAQQWRLKLALYVLLGGAFIVPYWLLQRHPVFTPHWFAWSALDHWVGFHPRWIWVYQSAYVFMLLPPVLSVSREELRTFARGFLVMTAVAVAFYVFLPIEAPRPADVPHSGLWAMLLSYDRTLNTFPSLHVAMVVQSLTFAAWMMARERLTAWIRTAVLTFGALWAVLIAYSTLATKQHYAIDLLPGVLLGWAAQRLAGFWPAVAARTVDFDVRSTLIDGLS
jgi:membrane-associated phospholipid phosphatase